MVFQLNIEVSNCDKLYFTFEFEYQIRVQITKIREGPNTYSPFIKLVESEY